MPARTQQIRFGVKTLHDATCFQGQRSSSIAVGLNDQARLPMAGRCQAVTLLLYADRLQACLIACIGLPCPPAQLDDLWAASGDCSPAVLPAHELLRPCDSSTGGTLCLLRHWQQGNCNVPATHRGAEGHRQWRLQISWLVHSGRSKPAGNAVVTMQAGLATTLG